MSPEKQAAFAAAKKNRDLFYKALRLLFGEQLGYRWERISAIRQLIEIIWVSQYELNDPEGPARAAQVTRRLAETEKASRALRGKVMELSELLTMYAGLLFPDGLRDPLPWNAIRNSKVYGADDDPRQNQSELYRDLLALEEACQRLGERIPADRGGRANLLTGRRGNPKAVLAYGAGLLFAQFRPGVISSNPKDPFYEFLGALYEILTGQEPEGPGVGLKKYVQFVAPLVQKIEENGNQRIPLMIKAVGTVLSVDEQRYLDRLLRELQALDDELSLGPPSGRKAT